MSADKEAGFQAFIARGNKTATQLYPHKRGDGSYVVSMTRFEMDYSQITNVADLLGWLEKGCRLRVSNLEGGVASTSLIEPGKIYRPILL